MNVIGRVAALSAGVALSSGLMISPASAESRGAPPDPLNLISSQHQEISSSAIEEALGALSQSELPRTMSESDGRREITFTLPNGIQLTFAAPSSRLGGGVDPQHGLYVEFNRTDQGIIASGGGAALATALCLLPGVGPALCILAVGVVGAATAALAANGFCSNNLRIYAQLLGYSECR